MNFKKPKLCNTRVIKYGKKMDMRSLNRDLNNIREMKQNRKEASLKNLNEYDSEGSYFCPICESEDYKFYVNIMDNIIEGPLGDAIKEEAFNWDGNSINARKHEIEMADKKKAEE